MSHNTWVHVTHDPMMNALKVSAAYLPPVHAMISLTSLQYHGDPGYLVKHTAKMMAAHIAGEIEVQLAQALSEMANTTKAFPFPKVEVSKDGKHAWVDPADKWPIGPQPKSADITPWSNPAHNPLDDINDFITKKLKIDLQESQKKAMSKIMGDIWGPQIEQQVVSDTQFAKMLGAGTAYHYAPGELSPASGAATGSSVISTLSKAIPGFLTMKQACPVGCVLYEEARLRDTIIHLNDGHHWTRERIADWLETLDHDLTFQIPEEVKEDAEHTDT